MYKAQEVTRRIEDILRLTYPQFKQLCMLAQGEFLRLLLAEQKQREDILRRLFGTQLYLDVQEDLARQEKALWQAVEEDNRLAADRCRWIQRDEGTPLDAACEKAEAGRGGYRPGGGGHGPLRPARRAERAGGGRAGGAGPAAGRGGSPPAGAGRRHLPGAADGGKMPPIGGLP